MLPRRQGKSPITDLKSVVFPAPLRPMRPAICPEPTRSETPRRILTNDFDVVLDEKHGHPLPSNRLEDHVHQSEFLLGAHPAGGLVEQEDPRPENHGHRDVQKLANSLRQYPASRIAMLGEVEAGDHLFRRGVNVSDLDCLARPGSRCSCDDARTHEQVLVSREAAKDLRNLERTTDAELGDLPRRQRGDVAAFVPDGSGSGFEVTGNQVEEGGFPRAVSTDHSDDGVLLDLDRDIRGGSHRAKRLGQTEGLQCVRHQPAFLPSAKIDHSPVGSNAMTKSIAKPTTICQVFGEYW